MNCCRLLLAGLILLPALARAEASARVATAAEQLTVLPGFKVELLRSALPGEGSWVCMAVEPKGRLIISPQEGVSNMLRITLSSSGQVSQLDPISQPVGS